MLKMGKQEINADYVIMPIEWKGSDLEVEFNYMIVNRKWREFPKFQSLEEAVLFAEGSGLKFVVIDFEASVFQILYRCVIERL